MEFSSSCMQICSNTFAWEYKFSSAVAFFLCTHSTASLPLLLASLALWTFYPAMFPLEIMIGSVLRVLLRSPVHLNLFSVHCPDFEASTSRWRRTLNFNALAPILCSELHDGLFQLSQKSCSMPWILTKQCHLCWWSILAHWHFVFKTKNGKMRWYGFLIL